MPEYSARSAVLSSSFRDGVFSRFANQLNKLMSYLLSAYLKNIQPLSGAGGLLPQLLHPLVRPNHLVPAVLFRVVLHGVRDF